MRLPDPQRSYAVLVGASSYHSDDLENLPAVANNLKALHDVLTNQRFGGLPPERCLLLQDPEEVRLVYRELRTYAQRAEDTFVFYFSGHGRIGLRNELYLALTDTEAGELPVSALALGLVRDVLADSPAANRVIVLDCCFSGRAIPDLGGPSELVHGQVDVEGTYTLTATSANAVALAPIGEKYTAFTGELLELLQHGVPGGPELLTFATLFPRLLHTMTARGLPAPKQRGIGTADRLALARNPAYEPAAVTTERSGLRRGSTPRLPDDLEILLSEEPILDIYSQGPWRVPDGLFEELQERALALNSDSRSIVLRRKLSDFYGEQVTAVGAELWSLLTFLLGASAVRGGSRADIDYEILHPFLAKPESPVRDPGAWFTQGGRWRPPGLWLPGSAGENRERREIMHALARECLELFSGIEPLEERRQALINLFDRRNFDPALHEQDLSAPENRLESLWAADLDRETLSILPELSGPLSYLEWACAGFAAAHERLANAVPGSDSLNVALARLLLQAEITQLPAELAMVLGNARYQAVEEQTQRLRDGYNITQWQEDVRGWLARCLIANEAHACRAWIDMAVRVTGAVQGLPDNATSPRCHVPVRGFQIDIHRLFNSRTRIDNPLARRLLDADASARRRRGPG